ncbi:hypothetical protein MNAN1_002079 [Malassezia nana]|uniref:Transmembrane protein n=1 Tax=Malassezia nana TaxID=180528 RepID=A0AAF0J3P7_9BASI|nr:hypothetical protein MNAN1_002079 [Malassezia nana]
MSDDAAAKREARKRRILEKSGDRLSRITNTGRGKDYTGLDTAPVAPRPESAAGPNVATASAALPPVSTPLTAERGPMRPSEKSDMEPVLSLPSGDDDQDAFARMLSAMQGCMGQAPGGDGPPEPMALLQQLLGQSGAPPVSMTPQPSHGEVAYTQRMIRRMRLLQATLVIVLAFYVVFSSIFSHAPDTGLTGRSLPTEAGTQFARDSYLRQWASLAQEYTPTSAWLSADDPTLFPWTGVQRPLAALRPYVSHGMLDGAWPSWPVFWVLVSMEVGLQGVRLAMLQRLPAALPRGVHSVVSLYAPGLLSVAPTILGVVSLASGLIDDLCILLFAIGAGVLFCQVWAPATGSA